MSGTLKADRISGLVVLLAALAMIFVVIPAYVETAVDGVLQPATLPKALCWLLVACGAWLVVRPGDASAPPSHQLRRAATHIGLLAGGVMAMASFGFVLVAPVLAFAIMVLIGERRPGWLVTGALVMPAMIWVFVVQILGRPLI
ncbi:MAG TPA: hypothetical protein DGU02_04965 [Alphaproteobacteria bacterium]|nr:hypothetical protein [Alphaproteobacteria bacterium]